MTMMMLGVISNLINLTEENSKGFHSVFLKLSFINDSLNGV